MQQNYNTYKDKVNACWIGKNIGGTMGAPYEGSRQMHDIKGFATKPGAIVPNDDLDLQLVWLYALETIGPYSVNAATLGEFWMSFITPHWNEYGISKANMSRGLLPPLSGDYENVWKNSNGAWIRTEIWACVAPGAPEIASRYAIEDAKVDHGTGEGTYAAAFVAGMQSAAFVMSDLRECIEVGLSIIPENSRVAQSVRFVIDCYDQGKSPIETRNAVLEMNSDIGDGWFEAPSNVAYAILGLLFGEGDFKKSMILTINCGDDTDCTAATVGATMGILGGMRALPYDWKEHIGDDIITISIARGSKGRTLPNTCTALTERVVQMAPPTLLANKAEMTVSPTDPDDIPGNIKEILLQNIQKSFRLQDTLKYLKPYSMHFECIMFDAYVTLDKAPDIRPLEACNIHITFANKRHTHENSPYNLSFRWILPEGFTVENGCSALRLAHETTHANDYYSDIDFALRAGDNVQPVNKLILEVNVEGRPTVMYIPITLLG